MQLDRAYRGSRVFVTGHTGFKGSWLCEWLLRMGAEVAGYSLAPNTCPALFDQLGLATRMRHQLGDVRDLPSLIGAIREFAPDHVFHLAAQPLVRASYETPVETFSTNTLGTAHVLEALRVSGLECSAVIVTTDKCYENLEKGHAYAETDRLGGHDPYSASKAAAELVIASYRSSFFSAPDSPVAVASARAGNVIGGGDWARDRIVPDAIAALQAGKKIRVRNPHSIRPWQHVLEPLGGYLLLGARLREGSEFADAFNFGPELSANRTVADLVAEVLKHWSGEWEEASDPAAPHEARSLRLDTGKAADLLGWRPVWDFRETVSRTVEWYRQPPEVAAETTRAQIADYVREAAREGLEWAQS